MRTKSTKRDHYASDIPWVTAERHESTTDMGVCLRNDPAKAYADTDLAILNAMLAVFWYILTKSSQGHESAVTLVAFPKNFRSAAPAFSVPGGYSNIFRS